MNVASSSPLFIAYLESIVRAIEQSRVHNSETDELTQQQLQDLNVKYKELKQQLEDQKMKQENLETDVVKQKDALLERIETVVSDLKAKIREVASEHTVFEGRFIMTRQPNAVHMGKHTTTCINLALANLLKR